ncbi:TniB family NTP-binding protein [Kangiella shandongensis]|uniref:TniB family NTP-binding protein n=1 Tax=Kangiella shandongensis TaxID=2763258 RepID=UPI001CBBE97A|nr:TniB family NTP-binding protein [Kangiella shandongensis]
MTDLKKVESFAIPHSLFSQAKQGIIQAIQLSEVTGKAENVILSGPAGTGKTKVCTSILHHYPPGVTEDRLMESTTVPAFYSSVPSPATIKGAAINMLKSMGAQDAHRGTTTEIQHRLGVLLKNCRTQVILLDELQHLLQPNSANNNVRDWLKSLINEYQIPIVAVGTPDCESLIDSDKQLARRFVRRYRLGNLISPLHSNEFGSYMATVIKIIGDTLNIDVQLNLKDSQTLLALFAATGGNPSDIEQIFKASLYRCIVNNKRIIKLKFLAENYESLKLPYDLCGDDSAFDFSLEELHEIIEMHDSIQ